MRAFLDYWITIVWFLGNIEFLSNIFIGGPTTKTVGLSIFISVGIFLIAVFWNKHEFYTKCKTELSHLKEAPLPFKALFLVVICIFCIAALEARLPPHLMQEADAINYHMSLPKQHLLSGSLSHISWSAADLWPLIVQWGFSPWWFSTSIYNKIPQFLCALWVFFILFSLSKKHPPHDEGEQGSEKSSAPLLKWIPALAVFSSHGIVIQLGTAMFDLTNLYFLLAFLHALQSQRKVWAALHLALYISAKSFHLPQVILMSGFLGITYLWLDSNKLKFFLKNNKSFLILSMVFSSVLLLRTFYVSIDRAGSPLFPFFVCKIFPNVSGCQGESGISILESAKQLAGIRDAYGEGRTLIGFLKHLFLLAIPTEGVNNRYDYPLGLPWLIWITLLIFSIPNWIKQRKISFYFFLAIGFWVVWWIGSQQSRWLYPVLALGWLSTMDLQQKTYFKFLCGALLLSASLSLGSQIRALKSELLKSRQTIQQEQTMKIKWNPLTKTAGSLETLYINDVIKKNSHPSSCWVLGH